MNGTTEAANSIYDKLTPQRKQLVDEVIKNLESEGGLWQKGWVTSGIPESGATGKKYRGINNFFLTLVSISRNYSDNRWVTFKQMEDRGWHFKKDEEGNSLGKGAGVTIEFYELRDKLTKKPFSKDTFTTVNVTDPSEDVIPDNVYSFEDFEGAANTLNTFATAADRACTSIEMSSGKANAHSGTRSIHFTVNTQVVVGWLPQKIFGTQKFGPNVGSISFWVRSVNGGKFTLWGVNTVTPSGTVYGTNQFELPAGVWTQITVDLTEAKYDDYRKADGGIEIYWIKFTAAVGEYYLDDFTINARQDYVTIEEVEAEIEQEIGEVTIPVPGVSEGATLTVIWRQRPMLFRWGISIWQS